MANVGFATLTVIPSARGFRRKLEDEVSGDVDRVGRQAGGDFGESFKRSVTPHVEETEQRMRRGLGGAVSSVGQRISRFGSRAGAAFVSLGTNIGGVAGSFTTKLGPAAAAVLPAIAATAVFAAGQIVALGAAGVATAVGIGTAFAGIGIGAALFSQTARGQAALERFKTASVRILTGAADPLLDSFADALPKITGLLRDLRPVMRSVFGALGGVVERGVDRAVLAFRQLGPAVGAVAIAGSEFFNAFSGTFRLISNRLTPALNTLAPSLSVIASILGQQLGASLSRLLPQLIRLGERALPLLPIALKAVTGALGILINLGNIAIDMLGFLAVKTLQGAAAWLRMNLALNQVLNAMPGVNRETQIAAARTGLLAAQANIAGARERFFGQQSGFVSGKLAVQTGRTRTLNIVTQSLYDTITTAIGGAIRYQETLDELSKELRKGAASFNINTKEGRENTQAVLDNIQAAHEQIQTYRDQGRTTAFVTRKTQQFARELVREARQAGFTNEQIRDLILSSNNIPRSIRQRIRSNASSVREVVQGLIGDINSIPSFKRVQVSVQTIQEGRVPLGGISARQHGGPVTEGRPFLVGEKGPEIFVPERDGRIVPNDRLDSRGGGRVPINIGPVYVQEPVDIDVLAQRLGFQSRAVGFA